MTPEPRLFEPDHFVTAHDDPAASLHHLISDWLSCGEPLNTAARWLKAKSMIPANEDFIFAALARLRHVGQSESILGNRFYGLRQRLEFLIAALLRTTNDLSEPVVVRMLESLPFTWELNLNRPFELAAECVAQHGFTPGLRRGLEILAHEAAGSASGQALRKKIDAFLFQAGIEKPKAGRCWSEVVRAAITAMPPESTGWQDLANSIDVHNVPYPSKKWERRARKILQTIGPKQFDAELVAWFSILETQGPFGLTTVGSYFMRTVLWYAGLEPSAAGLRAVGSFTNANWKTTKALQNPLGPLNKVAAACALLLAKYPPQDVFELFQELDRMYGYSESRVHDLFLNAARALGREREVQVPERPNPYELRNAGLRQSLTGRMRDLLDPASQLGSRVDAQTACLIVRGDVDRYRVDRETLIVERLSDGARTSADFTLIQDELARGQVKADATLIALLLIHDEPRQILRFSLGRLE